MSVATLGAVARVEWSALARQSRPAADSVRHGLQAIQADAMKEPEESDWRPHWEWCYAFSRGALLHERRPSRHPAWGASHRLREPTGAHRARPPPPRRGDW